MFKTFVNLTDIAHGTKVNITVFSNRQLAILKTAEHYLILGDSCLGILIEKLEMHHVAVRIFLTAQMMVKYS